MKEYLRILGALLRKDLLVELRSRERMAAMAAFSVLVPILVNFSLDRSVVRPTDVAAGWIWMTILFAGLLGMGRTFAAEREDGAFRGILHSPAPRDAIFLAKVVANFLLTFFAALLVFGAFSLFFSLPPVPALGPILLVLGAGVAGFAAVATLFSGISEGTSMGETLLPILVFPVLVPILVFGGSATSALMAGLPSSAIGGNLRMLAAYDLAAIAGGAILFRHVAEE